MAEPQQNDPPDLEDEEKPFDPRDHFTAAPYKAGRKTKYRANMCEINYEMLTNGDSINTVCARLGICKDTYHRWVKEHTPFFFFFKKGMANGNSYWDTATKQHILGNAKLVIDAAYIMKMRNVYGQMTKDPDASVENTKEFMRELAAIRSGGKVPEKDWDKKFGQKTSG